MKDLSQYYSVWVIVYQAMRHRAALTFHRGALTSVVMDTPAALPDAVQTERHGEPRVLMQAIESLRIVLDEADKPPTQESTAPTVDVRPQEPGSSTSMPTPQPMIEKTAT